MIFSSRNFSKNILLKIKFLKKKKKKTHLQKERTRFLKTTEDEQDSINSLAKNSRLELLIRLILLHGIHAK